MRYISWFTDAEAVDTSLVGGKGINLSRMASAGFPVPPGFCITADAYRYLMSVTGMEPVIAGILERTDFASTTDVHEKSAAIRELIEQQPIPADIASEVLASYMQLGRQLGQRHLEGTSVAVRSSATAEDLPDASFAGQQDTYLNVRGGTSLLEHVRRCWSSLWTARAMTYRQRQGYDHRKVYVAVVVQAMVNPEISGILFTANPISGARNECVINSSWGLGEAIVSGIVSPDTFVVDKSSGRIVQEDIATKDRQIVFSPHAGAVETDVPAERQQKPSLPPSQAAHLAALGTRVEEHYGAPQDIEWARAADNWYILQARPITTLAETAVDDDLKGTFSRAMFVEIFPDGLSPSFLSVVTPLLDNMLAAAFQQLGFKNLPEKAGVQPFRNQPYLSVNYIEEALQDIAPALRAQLVRRFTNIFEHDDDDAGYGLAHLQLMLRLAAFTRKFRRDFHWQLESYRADIESVTNLPLDSSSEAELLQYVRHICFEGAGPLLNNDFLLIATISVYTRLIARLLQPVFGDRTDEVVSNLVSAASGNIVMETNMMIWDLARTAEQDEKVKQILLTAPAHEALARLEELPAADSFLAQLRHLLSICGHREQRFDICFPTWGEDPTPVLAFVRGYLEAGESADPRRREAELLQQRSDLAAEAYGRLDRSAAERYLRRPLLRFLLPQAQWLVRERDTMHFEWTRIFPPVRRIQLELGRRWQRRGLLEHPDDIFYLSLSEQEELTRHPQRQQETVRERRAAYETNLAGPWPITIQDGRELAAEQKPAQSALEGDAISGVAGSPGYAEGPARIIQSPADFHRLRPGEILVAPMTNPVWTPLFAIAKGIVTEVGGILSHGAIVAREYGIPAVMSVPGVTGLLADGDFVAVDGNRGLVIRQVAAAQGGNPHKIAETHRELAHQSTL